jgi:peptide/nickel transport system substrate-binding protein
VARRAKKDPSDQGGWSAFLTSWNAADITNPVSAAYFAANCDKGPPGWPCDAKMEELRDKFAKEADPAKQKDIAEAVQVHAMEVGTHVHLGQWSKPLAYRKDKLSGMRSAPILFFWPTKKAGA